MKTNQKLKVLWRDGPKSHLAVSPDFIRRVVSRLRPAGCKSAIRQSSVLRYFGCGLAVLLIAVAGCQKKTETAEVSSARVENGQVIVEPGSPPANSVSFETA